MLFRSNLCCQFPIPADHEGVGSKGSKFTFYLYGLFWAARVRGTAIITVIAKRFRTFILPNIQKCAKKPTGRNKKKRARLLPCPFRSPYGLESFFGRDGEFLPAVTTAGRKDAAAVGSAHALTEAVLVDSLAV